MIQRGEPLVRTHKFRSGLWPACVAANTLMVRQNQRSLHYSPQPRFFKTSMSIAIFFILPDRRRRDAPWCSVVKRKWPSAAPDLIAFFPLVLCEGQMGHIPHTQERVQPLPVYFSQQKTASITHTSATVAMTDTP